VDEVFRWIEERFGPGVRSWIDEVPAVAQRVSRRWGMRLGELFAGGAASVVFRCEWTDGTPAVLKLSPDRALLGDQVWMLRLLGESGRVPEVLAADQDLGAVVLTEVRPGTEAEDLPAESLPGLWGGLLADLHAVAPPDDLARTLRERCEESLARIGKRLAEPAIGAHVSQELWRATEERCRRLLDSQTRTVLLHGDLHLGNALDGGAKGLVAIDPKVCVGDPCFDAFDLVVDGAGREGVDARCERVAAACGLDGDRLYEWAKVNATFHAIGRLSGGRDQVVDELLEVAR
jgi:streptomycin 6-kinase